MKYSDFCQQSGVMHSIKTLDDGAFLIYFLLYEGVIVYVGKSSEIRLHGRIYLHKRDKQFDSYFLIEGVQSESRALEIEKNFILSIRPKYNKAGLDRTHLHKRFKGTKSIYKNRHNFTLAPEEIAALEQIAKARGISASATIGQLAREEAARVAQSVPA